MRKIIFLLLICFVQNWFAQQTFKTSTKASQIVELLSQNKSVEWAIPISQSEKLTLQWSERKTSFTEKADIRTFVGYEGDSFIATVSISKTGDLSGDFTWKENQWRITTSKDGYLSISKENHSGECGGCHDGYCDTHNENLFNKKQLNTFSSTISKKQIHTDDILRVFRLAVLVDKHYYNRYGSKDAVRNFWSNLEISLNEYYAREIGIKFEIVNRDELIIDSTPIFDGKKAVSIIDGATAKINELIGGDNYDAGIVIAKNSDSNIGGLAGLGRINYSTSKAKAMSTTVHHIIAHELGHLFGSLHTFTTGGSFTIKTEPGNGQSIMSYGTPVNFFSLPSIYSIRNVLKTNSISGTPTNNQAPVINALKLKEEYILPKETFFQFKIDATDPDGDPLLYAFHQADIKQNNAQFESEKSTRDNTKAFYNHWQMESFVKREYDLSAGKTYTFWLGVNDTKDTYEERIKHPTRYDMYETKVKYVDGIPFKITNFQDKKYKTGEKVTLTWDVDDSLKNHKVRILLSNDFGQTFNYILAPETENDGNHEIVMPNITIGRKVYHKAGDTPIFHSGLGLIKIEVLDHIAFALTNNNVTNTNNGGFEIENSEITFTKTPPTNIKVPNENSIPDADIEAISSCPANNNMPLNLEKEDVKHQNSITRTWTAKDKCGNTASFVQHIEIDNTSTPPVSPLNFITPLPESMNINCSNEYSTTPDNIRVEGGKSPSVAVSEKRENLSDGKGFIITRTWVATDEVAESISHTQTITLRDEQAPVLSSQPENIEVNSENEVPQQQTLTATDCGEDIQVSSSSERKVINGKQVVLYHWEATDKYSNTTRYTQTITINEANNTPTPPTEKQNIGRVGINTDTPQATLDVRRVDLNLLPEGQPQGVSFPNFTTEKRNTFDKSKIKEGTMIYNTTEKCLEIFLNNE